MVCVKVQFSFVLKQEVGNVVLCDYCEGPAGCLPQSLPKVPSELSTLGLASLAFPKSVFALSGIQKKKKKKILDVGIGAWQNDGDSRTTADAIPKQLHRWERHCAAEAMSVQMLLSFSERKGPRAII